MKTKQEIINESQKLPIGTWFKYQKMAYTVHAYDLSNSGNIVYITACALRLDSGLAGFNAIGQNRVAPSQAIELSIQESEIIKKAARHMRDSYSKICDSLISQNFQ